MNPWTHGRNRVKDFDFWLAYVRSHHDFAAEYGLMSLRLWQNKDDLNNVFFLFDIKSHKRAMQFMRHSASVKS